MAMGVNEVSIAWASWRGFEALWVADCILGSGKATSTTTFSNLLYFYVREQATEIFNKTHAEF
jgi:hypothetical protein